MNRTGRIWGVAATAVVALALLLPADSGAAEVAPAADPAGGGLPPLASYGQSATSAVGSTRGFPIPPVHHDDESEISLGSFYSASSGGPMVPGATGVWQIEGPGSSSLTIDSCGSSFPAQLTVYRTDNREGWATPVAYSADGCADPIALDYATLLDSNTSGPGVVRIDDATGEGGRYHVNYRRTLGSGPVAKIRSIRVGKVERLGDSRTVGTAKVTIVYRAYPLVTTCRLDERFRPNHCPNRRIVFKRVKSGRHSFQLDAYQPMQPGVPGGGSTATRDFRVPYLR